MEKVPAPPDASLNPTPKGWTIAGIIALIIIVGILIYPWAKAEMQVALLREKFSLNNYPKLALTPTPLGLSVVTPAKAQAFSYYGITFSVPWSDAPKLITSKDGAGTQLKFSNGQFITVLEWSSYANTAQTIASSSEVNAEKIKSIYGNLISSDFDFLMGTLNSTPTSTSGSAIALLPLKQVFFAFAGPNGEPIAIYNFSLPTLEGVQLVSHLNPTNAENRVNFFFTPQGKGAHDFVIGSTTQEEANEILASVQMK